MPAIQDNATMSEIDALCRTTQGAFAVAVSHLSPDGCTATAPAEWAEEFDFLRLTLAGQAEINGRVVRHEGKVADIRFFGQISPLAIAAWGRKAA